MNKSQPPLYFIEHTTMITEKVVKMSEKTIKKIPKSCEETAPKETPK
jgi:hypothetical protein